MSTNIEPNKTYYLAEVLAKKFIPGVSGYSGLYNLITQLVPDPKKDFGNGIPGVRRELVTETTYKNIRAMHEGKPWNKIKGKIKIQGAEIIKFLKLNSLI